MNNQKGSILVITSGFVLIFTMLGLASIYMATVHNEDAEKLNTSAQALWIADSGIEVGKTKVPPSGVPTGTPPTYPSYSDNFGITCNDSVVCQDYLAHMEKLINPATGTYYVHRWKTISAGTVKKGLSNTQNTRTRTIEAVISEFVINAITTDGTVNGDCGPQGSAEIIGSCEANVEDLTLQNYFNINYSNNHSGVISITNAKTGAPYSFHSYTDSDYDKSTSGGLPVDYTGLTVITINNSQGAMANQINKSPQIVNTPAQPGLLIVDCAASVPTCYQATGNIVWNGIIWIIGNVDMTGTPDINGSLFVRNGLLDIHQSGNNSVEYREDIIDTLLTQLGGGTSLKVPAIVSWKEI